LRLSDWFERWFPDAFALALAATAVVALASILSGSTPFETAQRFGAGFWDLTTFTIQMSMVVVTGYALATARMWRCSRWSARSCPGASA
jgi:short-chain fatty acids transporter